VVKTALQQLWLILFIIYTHARNWHTGIGTYILTFVLIPMGISLYKLLASRVKAFGSYLIDGLLYYPGLLAGRAVAARVTLTRYCRLELEKGSKFLYIPSSRGSTVEIDSVFVTLRIETGGNSEKLLTHRDLLDVGLRMRIEGDPGSGKSSLVKRLFRDACRSAISANSKSRFPILVEMKNLEIPDGTKDSELGKWFYSDLKRRAGQTAAYKVEQCFETYARTTGLLVLLDGLDEVSTPRYPRVQKAILALGNTLSSIGTSNAIVLTMRTQFHQQVRENFREGFGVTLSIKPFTPTDIYEFLSRWPFRRSEPEAITRIYAELTDHPTLREMCSNPLILAMYVAERQSSAVNVTPESRTEFYRRVTDELLVKRRATQTGPIPALSKLREQRERILGKLAFDHMLDKSQPANSLLWSDAVNTVRGVMRCTEQRAADVFRDLAKETGLISEERPGETFRFIHLTFCEFLAAHEAVHGQPEGWKKLLDAHRAFRHQPQARTRLQEAIPFACGLLPRVARSEAVNAVAGLRDQRLLARTFLETKDYENSTWAEFVALERTALLRTGEENWGEEWLRDLHLFNVVVRDANHCVAYVPGQEGPIDLSEFYQALVATQRWSLSKLLSAYASQDAVAAFRLTDICNLNLAGDFPGVVIANCDQRAFFAMVLERARREKDRQGLWATLLVESALKSRPVALWLYMEKCDTSFDDAVAKSGAIKSWQKHRFIWPSLYSQLLTLAVANREAVACPCPGIELLRSVTPPGRLGWRSTLCGMPSMFVGLVGTFAISIVMVTSVFFSAKHELPGPLEVVVALGLVGIYATMLARTGYRIFYSSVFNLSTTLLIDKNKPRQWYLSVLRLYTGEFMALVPKREKRLLKRLEDLRARQGPATNPTNT